VTQEPEALRLADALEEKEYPPRRAAANELRRLEAANAQLLDKVLQAIKEMRPAAEAVKDKPASWWLDRFEEAVKELKEKNHG
jgi:hypothetical protein